MYGGLDLYGWAALLVTLSYLVISETFWRRKAARSLDAGTHDSHTTRLMVASLPTLFVLPLAYAAWVAPREEEGLTLLQHYLRLQALSLMLFACWLRHAAMTQLGAFFSRTLTVQKGHCVIKTGVYRLVRHPGYAANLAIFVSYAFLVSRSPIVTVLQAGIFYFAWCRRRIPAEEAMLMKEFGDEYVQYMSRTHRLVPWVY
mmetsp:Transcript_21024/g.53230  ORF Transcript_21024/g.53230 Transcript_21024/m.53230 type:complete len:201 (+) Transcript_21024:207-809(+)